MGIVSKLLWVFLAVVTVYAAFMMYGDVSRNLPPKKPPAESEDGAKTDGFVAAESESSAGGGNKQNRLVVGLFHAEWCGHCTSYLASGMFMDAYAHLSADPAIEGVEFRYFDYDKHKQLAGTLGIEAFPTIVAMAPAGAAFRKVGFFDGDRTSKKEIRRFVEASLLKAAGR
jgi:thiol-disulfide isomerase/thioredoxin